MEYLTKKIDNKIKQELAQFDQEMIEIEGKTIQASACFHFSSNPVHLLFNTNCPDSLKDKITAVVRKHHPGFISPDKHKALRETKEYQLLAEAFINGRLVQKNIDSISGTENFSESYLQDLAMQYYSDEFPKAEIQIQSVKLLPVT